MLQGLSCYFFWKHVHVRIIFQATATELIVGKRSSEQYSKSTMETEVGELYFSSTIMPVLYHLFVHKVARCSVGSMGLDKDWCVLWWTGKVHDHYTFIQVQLVMLPSDYDYYQQCIFSYDPGIKWIPKGYHSENQCVGLLAMTVVVHGTLHLPNWQGVHFQELLTVSPIGVAGFQLLSFCTLYMCNGNSCLWTISVYERVSNIVQSLVKCYDCVGFVMGSWECASSFEVFIWLIISPWSLSEGYNIAYGLKYLVTWSGEVDTLQGFAGDTIKMEFTNIIVDSHSYAAGSIDTKRSEVFACQYAQRQVPAAVFISMRQQVGDSTLLDWVWRLAWIMMILTPAACQFLWELGPCTHPVVQSFALLRHISQQVLGFSCGFLVQLDSQASQCRLYLQTRGHLLYIDTCGVVPAHAALLIQVDTRLTPYSLKLPLLIHRGEYISLTVGLCLNHLATAQVCRLVCDVISSSGGSPFMIWAWRLLIGIGTLVALLWRIAWHILANYKITKSLSS